VAADLGFLTMDLERLGAGPMAAAAVRAYVARTGDPDLGVLLPFYASYIAWVRGKVTVLRIRQLPQGDPARPALEDRARSLFALSLRLAWRARLPLVVVLCGVAGTGKSTLAAELSSRSGLPHLGSDQVRKELAGTSPDTRGTPELYTPEFTLRTYRELAARARAALASSAGAVVDATFHRREQRALPEEALRSRGAARAHTPEHASDATWSVTAAQLSSWEPLEEISPGDRHVLSTDRPVETCLDELDSFVSAAVDTADPRPPIAS
jgi:hypothetical protein